MGLASCVTMGIDEEDKQVEVLLDGCRRLLRQRREDALSGRDIRGSISFHSYLAKFFFFHLI